MEDVATTLGANVRRLRLERSMTQDALAQGALMDAREIRRIESGERPPGLRVLARIAFSLDVPPGRLLDGVAWRPPS